MGDSPLLLLDLDDTLCLNKPYGGRHLQLSPRPPDLYQRLWSAPAVDALQQVLREARPQVVLTTSWLSFLDLAAARQLFELTGLESLAHALHPDGEAPQLRGQTRAEAIDTWLRRYARTGRYAIVDDPLSGTGLRRSRHDRSGRVVFCEVDVGLSQVHVPRLLRALTR
ncbi:HAD domain-containing protein [Paracidovorax konjaci]|nr:HAD domain-containing protein [Paracidovorax konjaci]